MIRSHADAYELAQVIDNALAEGETLTLHLLQIRKQDDRLYAIGQSHRCDEGEQKYVPCEFADFVLWPERRRVNDWLRWKVQQARFEQLRSWPALE